MKHRNHIEKMKLTDVQAQYMELLEYIHTRYRPTRPDNPGRAVELSPHDANASHGIKRLPIEMERRFLDIVLVIIKDKWEVPEAEHWIQILDFIELFKSNSPLFAENPLNDCHRFFHLCS